MNQQPMRINIQVDPEMFPEVYQECLKLRQRRGRVDGSRLLHLATIGLLFSNNAERPAAVSLPRESKLLSPGTDKAEVVLSSEPVIEIDPNELEDLDNIMKGNFN